MSQLGGQKEETKMESIWSKETTFPVRETLQGDKEIDTAVIGGGLAGILIAWELQERGIPVMVLEADRVGSGQTRNTTAKITCQHGLLYDKLIRNFGMEQARQYARANREAIEAYRALIDKKQIDCQLETVPAYLYSEREDVSLKREVAAARQLGITARFTKKTALPFPVKGAVRFEEQAQFHPLKFLRALADQVTVCEHTRVKRVADHLLETDRGTVRAKHIVFACHYPFVNFPGLYFARMHQERSYVIALRQAGQLDGAYLGIDPGGLSLRNAGAYLLLGGEGRRTGGKYGRNPYASLLEKGKRWYPDCRPAARWSAQDCMPVDGVPYIGRYAGSKPYWYVATGFQKWGMTSAMVSARLISDLICGIQNENAGIFSPQRFRLRASAMNLAADLGQSMAGLTKGALSAEAPRCPHLGCQLEWNPAERTWECPCHGSRFDQTGALLDGPAQKDICPPDDLMEPSE